MSLTPLQIKDILDENREHECEGYGIHHECVRIASIAELPSRFGNFQVVAFWNNRDDKDHAAFVHGDVTAATSWKRPCKPWASWKTGSCSTCARRGGGSV